jgi:hypothetical protein
MRLKGRFYKFELWHVRLCIASQRTGRGDRNAVLPLMWEAIDDLFRAWPTAAKTFSVD